MNRVLGSHPPGSLQRYGDWVGGVIRVLVRMQLQIAPEQYHRESIPPTPLLQGGMDCTHSKGELIVLIPWGIIRFETCFEVCYS